MSSQDEVRIDWDGLDEMILALSASDEQFLNLVIQAMDRYTNLVETGATALAHRFSGELEESIKASAASAYFGMVVGSVGSNLSYAWIRHERPYRPGTHDMYDRGVKFPKYYLNGRGRRTHRKASWRGLVPGRKYLERAVVATENKDFEEIFLAALDEFLEGLA